MSTPGQEENGTSLDTQLAACRRYAAERGLIVSEAHVYVEVYSGAALYERPKLAALREAVRRGEFAVVVCYALDRLSRKQTHVAIVAEEFDQAGIELAFVTESFENSAVGQFIRNAKAFAAELEREKIAERTQRGLLARVRSGKPRPGRRAPYGYGWADAVKSRLEENPDTAPIVRWIFAEAASGQTVRGIAREINERGIPSPTGLPFWRASTVYVILANPTYAGRAAAWRTISTRNRFGRKTMKLRPADEHIALPDGTAPALVDAATFDAVQQRLRLNKERAARNNRDPESALLRTGFARCGHCGGSLCVSRGNRGRNVNYRCGRANESKHTCSGSSIPAGALDSAVWSRVSAILTNPDVVAAELARQRGDDPTEADLARVDKSIAQAERQHRALVGHLANLDPDSAELAREQLAALSARRRGLIQEREAIMDRRRGWELARDRLGQLEAWCSTVAANLGDMTYEQKRTALDALGVRVQVWRTGHEPRYQIEAGIPLGDEAASNPHASTRRRP